MKPGEGVENGQERAKRLRDRCLLNNAGGKKRRGRTGPCRWSWEARAPGRIPALARLISESRSRRPYRSTPPKGPSGRTADCSPVGGCPLLLTAGSETERRAPLVSFRPCPLSNAQPLQRRGLRPRECPQTCRTAAPTWPAKRPARRPEGGGVNLKIPRKILKRGSAACRERRRVDRAADFPGTGWRRSRRPRTGRDAPPCLQPGPIGRDDRFACRHRESGGCPADDLRVRRVRPIDMTAGLRTGWQPPLAPSGSGPLSICAPRAHA